MLLLEACERFERWWRRYLEAKGLPGSTMLSPELVRDMAEWVRDQQDRGVRL